MLAPRAERRVEEALRRIGTGRPLVLIVHRLPAAARADRIAVMAGGRIVEEGRHRDVLAAGGVYARAWSAGSAAA